MLKFVNVRVLLDDERSLEEIVAKKLRIATAKIQQFKILRKALDARRKEKITFVYSVSFVVSEEQALLKLQKNNKDLTIYKEIDEPEVVYGQKELSGPIVVVGAGPAGLIAALMLAKHGYKPLLLERGKKVDERIKDVQNFWQKGILSSESNVQFGEGGAGTFSDGKLTTRVNDPINKAILQLFVQAGAPEEILYEYKPHVGTDMLRKMVKGLSQSIIDFGGEMQFSTCLENVTINDKTVEKIKVSNKVELTCGALLLAIGHSARDTYKMLFEQGVKVEAKPFSIGVRIEHPQEFIDKAQYGIAVGNKKLGPADYALVYHDKVTNRSAYSFCMCPGGVVVASASSEGELVVNGMSMYNRNSGIANSALVVGVGPKDFGEHPLAGIAFQQKWEQLAFAKAGGDYHAPAQNLESFLNDSEPVLSSICKGSYLPGIRPVRIREVLPDFVTETLAKSFNQFGRTIKMFDHKEALLTGVETRTSSPIRIARSNETRQSVNVKGIYPVGEGAGYAGGIMSAAIDGYYAALALMKEYKQPK